MMIPVSMLSTYLFCPRKLFLEQVLALREPPKETMVLGSIRHEVFDFVNKADENIVSSIQRPANYEEIKSIYESFYRKKIREIVIKNKSKIRKCKLDMVATYNSCLPSVLDEAHSRAENVTSFMSKNKLFGKDLWDKLSPKIISEIGNTNMSSLFPITVKLSSRKPINSSTSTGWP